MAEDLTREARFNQLYDDHFDAIRRYVWRRAPLNADDVAAETFLIAWRRLDDVPANALPWLITVARSTLLNERRGSRRQAAVSGRLAAEPPPSPPSEDDAVGAGSELVEAALAALSERDREVLLLSVWEDLDRAAIAHALDCSKANVSVRLHRARRRFAEELERQPPAGGSLLRPATFSGGFDA